VGKELSTVNFWRKLALKLKLLNSPGGYANVSDFIWREVKLATEVKPVIASMGNVAASGGYYIACSADTIVADKNTITGSIGIYGLFFSGEELIKETFGLTTDSYGTNEHAAFGGSYPLMLPISSRKFTKTEEAIIQNIVNNGYDTFLNRVADGRNMTVKQVHEVAQGRVWNAIDAQKNGLVDVLGGLETAIQLAKEKAGVEDFRIVSLPKLKNPFETIIEDLTGKATTKILKNELGSFYNTYEKTQDLIQLGGIQARIPYEIDLH
jgi:protease IV